MVFHCFYQFFIVFGGPGSPDGLVALVSLVEVHLRRVDMPRAPWSSYNKKCNIDLLSMFITQSKASKLKRLIAILKTTILEAVKICNNIFGRQLWKTTYTWVSFCWAGK